MTRIETLAGELDALRSEIAELDSTENLTDEQSQRFAAALAEWDTKKAEHDELAERAAKVEAVRSAAIAAPKQREAGFSAPQVITSRAVDTAFENLDMVRQGMLDGHVLRSRALAGIEEGAAPGVPDSARENAVKLIEGGRSDIARHALLTGSPAYRAAFETILENPQGWQSFVSPEQAEAVRAALSTTVGNGGYAIPFLLDPTVILTNAGSANPFRQLATIVRGTSNKWQGVTSAGVTAEWKSEGAQAADASPTVAQPSITAYLADAYVFGSYEVFQDTNLATQLPGLIADAKDRLEADAFAVGSGSGAPFGVVTSTTAVTASRVTPTTGGTFTTASSADVFKVLAALDPRHRSSASWVANYAIYNVIRQQSASAAGSAFWANMGANLPEQLLGRPIYEASAMASSFTTGSNILLCGNFERYVIFDRIGMQLDYIPNVISTSNARPTAQRGWLATWRTGSDVVDANAFRVLKL